MFLGCSPCCCPTWSSGYPFGTQYGADFRYRYRLTGGEWWREGDARGTHYRGSLVLDTGVVSASTGGWSVYDHVTVPQISTPYGVIGARSLGYRVIGVIGISSRVTFSFILQNLLNFGPPYHQVRFVVEPFTEDSGTQNDEGCHGRLVCNRNKNSSVFSHLAEVANAFGSTLTVSSHEYDISGQAVDIASVPVDSFIGNRGYRSSSIGAGADGDIDSSGSAFPIRGYAEFDVPEIHDGLYDYLRDIEGSIEVTLDNVYEISTSDSVDVPGFSGTVSAYKSCFDLA